MPDNMLCGDEFRLLADRLEKLEGADREVDCEIAVVLDGFFTMPPRYEGAGIRYCYTDADGGTVAPGQAPDMLVRQYTASLDEATRLATRILPRMSFALYVNRGDDHEVIFWGRSAVENKHAFAPTPAIALLRALLSAKQAQDSNA